MGVISFTLFRYDIIQKVIDAVNAKKYLEVGLGPFTECFQKITCKNKIGVDPCRPCNIDQLINEGTKYIQLTSDKFFEEKNKYIEEKFDVIFIDGLHEYKQVLKDVENSLECIKDDGVILMHDCTPYTKEMATPFTSTLNLNSLPLGVWTGDVWKAAVHLRSTRDDINLFVMDTDFGVGVITKGENKNKLNLSISEIENMTYGDLDKNRKELLNLKDEEYIDEFCKELKKID